MFGKRSRKTNELIAKIERQVDRVYTAILVRDPGTSLSSDAYEGLRKQVIASARARTQHVAQLAEFDVALRRGATVEALQDLVDGWLRQAGVERVEDPAIREVWEVIPASHEVEVELPAYVDSEVGRLVRQGRLRERVIEMETAPVLAGAAGSLDPANEDGTGSLEGTTAQVVDAALVDDGSIEPSGSSDDLTIRVDDAQVGDSGPEAVDAETPRES